MLIVSFSTVADWSSGHRINVKVSRRMLRTVYSVIIGVKCTYMTCDVLASYRFPIESVHLIVGGGLPPSALHFARSGVPGVSSEPDSLVIVTRGEIIARKSVINPFSRSSSHLIVVSCDVLKFGRRSVKSKLSAFRFLKGQLLFFKSCLVSELMWNWAGNVKSNSNPPHSTAGAKMKPHHKLNLRAKMHY